LFSAPGSAISKSTLIEKIFFYQAAEKDAHHRFTTPKIKGFS